MSRRTNLDRRTVLKLLGAGAAASAAGSVPGAAATPTGGRDAYWTTGQQFGFGTVQDHGADTDEQSRAWFTLTEGALAQVRFPRIDLINLRTLDFVVADADGDYAERTYDADRTDDGAETLSRSVEPAADDALLFRQAIAETGDDREWMLTAEYVTHPGHDAVLADVSFEAGDGRAYDVYALADPSMSMSGMADEAAVHAAGRGGAPGGGANAGDGDGGDPGAYALSAHDTEANDESAVILESPDGESLAGREDEGEAINAALGLAAADGFDWATVDVVGGEAWTALLESGDAPTTYDEASGNVALVGRLGSGASVSAEVGLGFAEEMDVDAALKEARTALRPPFRAVRDAYRGSWRDYLDGVTMPESVAGESALANQYRFAAMSLKAADSKTFPGAGIASPSVPWGDAVLANRPDDYGYNYVWARDLYQAYTAFLAMDDVDSAVEALEYVYEYQQRDSGFLPQNTFLDGRTRWGGEQMDEISFPQLMAYQLWRRHDVSFDEVSYDYENVRRSADYVVANGPFTAQERWEEEGGLSPSTTAAEIAGLTAAAELGAATDHPGDALVYLGLADEWQTSAEDWMATTQPPNLEEPDDIGEEYDVDYTEAETPYYFRINADRDPNDGDTIDINNGGPALDERAIIDSSALELVRLGVKPADDEAVRNTVALVDGTIRVETPHGPAWYRYTEDGYGEQGQNPDDDYPPGAPWTLDNTGRGRLWPIFSGERGEYELLAESDDDSVSPPALLRSMQAFANSGRMIPEQVWDREDPSPYGWEFGEGTGSATPLSWSMAQFVRLARSIDAGRPVERPAVTTDRYVEGSPPEGPSLSVAMPDTRVTSETVTVRGTTDGDAVAVKTDGETVYRRVDDGAFCVEMPVSEGETVLTVAAGRTRTADGGLDLSATGATVRQKTLARPDLGERVESWDDPTGDDYGPGDYTYPTANEFVEGAFDITEFGVYETEERYQFHTSIAGELTNPWGGDGLSLQTLQVYLRNPGAGGGATEARTGVNAAFEAPYHYRVVAEGFRQPAVERPDGDTVTDDVTLASYESLDAFTVSVPKSAFDAPVTQLRLVPLLLGHDGAAPGRVRPVAEGAAPYRFGGGSDDGYDPNVIDLVTPEGVTNAEALAYSAERRATIPYLTL